MTDDLISELHEWTQDLDIQDCGADGILFRAIDRIEKLEGSKDRWKTAFLDLQKASEGISDLAMKYKEALTTIGYGPPDEGNALTILNEFVDIARAALGEKKDGN